jgi:hypothetical protein
VEWKGGGKKAMIPTLKHFPDVSGRLREIMEELSQNTLSLHSILTVTVPQTKQYLYRKFFHQNSKMHCKSGHRVCDFKTPIICDYYYYYYYYY